MGESPSSRSNIVSRFASVGAALIGGYAIVVALPSAPNAADYNSDVLPILKAHCYQCHSGDQKMGALSVDSLAGMLRGGAGGPAVIVGKSAASPLIRRILGQDGKPRMPMGFGPLAERDVTVLRNWIDQGAKTSAGTAVKKHWAYQKPSRPAIPKVKLAGWVTNPIDAFVLSGIERQGLKPSPPADRVTLIRRVTLDLIGLPPTPDEVDAFVADRSPNAYQKVVDRLFANPHFGEKMALPWLDAARYADSNGFQQDGDTYQYVWRDWVVSALNANMPFDQFTVQQLAGDLLPTATEDTASGRAQLIASAFNRNHMLNGEGGAIPEEQRNVNLYDRVDTTSTTWLGLTMACARCHDHKYDPLTQRDYYSLLAYFNNVPETGVPEGGGQYRIAPPWIYAGSDSQLREMEALKADLAEAKKLGLPLDKLKEREKKLSDFQDTIPRVMVMSDRQPRESHIYSRGNYTSPLDKVSPTTPAALPPMPAGYPPNRLGLARWIISADNPLTARVQVNRFWQTFFGKGLVRTPENFGVQSEPPTQPQLLDWLAVDFRENDWDVKRLLRMIVMSSAYRQSSKVSPEMEKRDPENRLLARGARFRLPAMLLRDEALAASGLLNPAMGGKPVYPYEPKGIWDGLQITEERDFTYPQSKGADLYRRSIYSFWRRTVAPGNMFDAPTRQFCAVRLYQTSTPLHALTTLNDVTWVEAGRVLADKVMTSVGKGEEANLAEAFRRVCARRPDPSELQILVRALKRAQTAFAKKPKDAESYLSQGESPRDQKLDLTTEAAYATVCSAILNLDEALTRE